MGRSRLRRVKLARERFRGGLVIVIPPVGGLGDSDVFAPGHNVTSWPYNGLLVMVGRMKTRAQQTTGDIEHRGPGNFEGILLLKCARDNDGLHKFIRASAMSNLTRQMIGLVGRTPVTAAGYTAPRRISASCCTQNPRHRVED